MSNLNFSKTFVDGQTLPASDLNTLQNDVSGYINARNSGASTWDALSAASSTNVPLTLNNSVGTQDICRMQDNGANVFQLQDGGSLTLSKQPAFFAYRATSAQSISGSNVATVSLNATLFDIRSEFNTGSGIYTATTAGIYLFTYGIYYTFSSTPGAFTGMNITTDIIKNSTVMGWIRNSVLPSSTVSEDQKSDGMRLLQLSAGDTVKLQVENNADVAINLNFSSGNQYVTFLTGVKIA